MIVAAALLVVIFQHQQAFWFVYLRMRAPLLACDTCWHRDICWTNARYRTFRAADRVVTFWIDYYCRTL